MELRYTPGDPSDVWVVGPDGSRTRVSPTDKAANAEAGRVRLPWSVDYSRGV